MRSPRRTACLPHTPCPLTVSGHFLKTFRCRQAGKQTVSQSVSQAGRQARRQAGRQGVCRVRGKEVGREGASGRQKGNLGSREEVEHGVVMKWLWWLVKLFCTSHWQAVATVYSM